MKTYFGLMATAMGGLVLSTGNLWFLLPQFAFVISLLLLLGADAYELCAKKAK